jgi:hypothetical protein
VNVDHAVDKTPVIRESRPVKKKRTVEEKQVNFWGNVMFAVQSAIVVYEKQMKDNFPLDLQVKRFAMGW